MYANPRKTPSVKQLGYIDVSTLIADVLAIPAQVWEQENAEKPNPFTALDKTQHIVFRFVSDFGDWRSSYNRPIWDEWRGRIEPVLAQVVASYGYRNGAFPRIMLAKMAPGGVIHPHIDSSPAAQWPHKIHVPIQTNNAVKFFIKPHHYHFDVGQAVELNNLDEHAVKNEGQCDRIHLIFEYYDCEQNSWLTGK